MCENIDPEKQAFEKLLPTSLYRRGYSFEDSDTYGLAWSWADAISVTEHLVSQGYVILGGDVCEVTDRGVRYVRTGDNWYTKLKGLATISEAIQTSKQQTIEYITMYKQRNGEGYAYTLIFERAIALFFHTAQS